MIQNASVQIIAGNNPAAIVSAGKTVRVFEVHLISSISASTISLKNGSDTNGTIYLKETGVAPSNGKTFTYGDQGVLFPAGCFVTTDGTTTRVEISYTEDP